MTNTMVQTRHLVRLLAVILFSVLLTACGTDDGDSDPTATSAPPEAQTTVVADTESPVSLAGSPDGTSVPANTDMSTVDVAATPSQGTAVFGSSTPETNDAASPAADVGPGTPTTGVVGQATPDDDLVAGGTSSPPAGTEAQAIPADTEVGDGTTGAIVAGTPVAATPDAAASPVVGSASPVAGASPVAVVTVTGCDVPDVPPFTGAVTSFILAEDLNFRTGPGPDCDLALPEPIGAFQVVEVIGGPVVREDDGTEWVQIRTLDTDGWVVFEFLEPVED